MHGAAASARRPRRPPPAAAGGRSRRRRQRAAAAALAPSPTAAHGRAPGRAGERPAGPGGGRAGRLRYTPMGCHCRGVTPLEVPTTGGRAGRRA
ncbi:hypothetical protein BU14_2331s0001 [Porphyra umbilicalis]|uniref:Uncharacterized protein n=1 Tax=Porphyra umbilicalis TaxID=2786 RepID=A0A1X6NJR6_PORUM|nr:hypothetical protein BU14_2331s0001 [Porphyra umbilicalis]|eukprot:OSX68726.1 hypothetical protein BU14_2331s0001 [Porphyra umbilicalis]